MEYKKLIHPEFRITAGEYILTSGIEVECFSSKASHLDWCRVELSNDLKGTMQLHDMDEAEVELGYGDDYDTVMEGYVRKEPGDYWKEIMIKDDLIKLERVRIKGTFIDCTPQDVIRYILTCAGIDDYELSPANYGTMPRLSIEEMDGIRAISEVNAAWGIQAAYYFQNRVFRWGSTKEQEEIYILEENENILSLNKYGDLWEVETLGIPWIHHSQQVEVRHGKYSGIVEVEKTIVRSDDTGAVHMFIYFKGGSLDV